MTILILLEGNIKMIKIIRHGTRQTKECERCGCLFSYDEVDICKVPSTHIIECPQCKEKIVLEAIK